jgi:hypothetical protein
MGISLALMGVPGVGPGAGGDAIGPYPTITLAEGVTEPVSAAFGIVITWANGAGGLPEAVTGFAVGDITVTNAALSDFATADNITFTATVTPDWAGDVTLAIAAGVCEDAARNESTASETLGVTVWLPSLLNGLACWLRRDSGFYQDAEGTTPCVNDVDPVGLWQDASGNGKHFTQATANKKPTYRLNSFGVVPAVRFVTDDYLTGGTGWNTDAMFIAVLVKPGVDITAFDTTRFGIYAIASGGDDRHMLVFGGLIASTSRIASYSNTGATAEESFYTGAVSAGTKFALFSALTADGTQLYVNNAGQTISQSATTNPPLSAGAEARLGVRFGVAFTDFLNGDIAEFIVCSSIPDAGQLASLYSYFSTGT